MKEIENSDFKLVREMVEEILSIIDNRTYDIQIGSLGNGLGKDLYKATFRRYNEAIEADNEDDIKKYRMFFDGLKHGLMDRSENTPILPS